MSDERRRWYFLNGNNDATGDLLLADAQHMDTLLMERDRLIFAPQLPDSSMPLMASLSGSLGLLLGALAFAAIAGWHLLRRRGKRYHRLHQVMSHRRDHDGTLLPAYASGMVLQSPDDIRLKLQRRTRLESLLQAALDDQGVPRDNLDMGLMHQLGDGGQLIAEEESRPLFSPADAWARSAARPASAGALGSRRWDLASHLLQLTPGALVVSANMLCKMFASAAAAWKLAHLCCWLQAVRDSSGKAQVIGRGAHGIVFLGRLGGEEVAIKVLGWTGIVAG